MERGNRGGSKDRREGVQTQLGLSGQRPPSSGPAKRCHSPLAAAFETIPTELVVKRLHWWKVCWVFHAGIGLAWLLYAPSKVLEAADVGHALSQ
jgi:hypothetical protein